MMTYTRLPAHAVVPGHVVTVKGGTAWRIVREVREPRGAIAGAIGALVLECTSYVDPAAVMPPATYLPGELVTVVGTLAADGVAVTPLEAFGDQLEEGADS